MASETKYVDGVVFALTGLTGAYTNVTDDPSSPDGNWVTTTGSGGTLRASFPTPSGNPNTGSGLQTFRIWVRKNASAGGTPTVAINLYENGSLVSALTGNVSVTSDTGELVSATWDASLLSNVDGSQVEIYLDCRKGGGGGNERNVEVGAIAWDVDYATVDFASLDTVTKANIQSISGIAVASIQSFNGVAF